MTAEDEQPVSERGDPEQEQSILAQISRQMVRALKQYYGKGPDHAKSYIVDDLLFIVMRGSVIPAEQTLVASGREDDARAFRQQFQNEMEARLVYMIEQLTGRRVVNYQSQVLYDPDVVIEMFVFDRPAPPEQVRQTIESLRRPAEGGAAGADEPGR